MTLKKLVLPSAYFDNDRAILSFLKTKPYFSKPKARDLQTEIIGTIRAAIEDNDIKYIFLQLGTGEGKSVTAITIAEYFRHVLGKSYYLLSMDLGLTAQYKRDFEFLKEVKGRNNFNCVLPGNAHLTAAEAPCTVASKSFHCPSEDVCPYRVQRNIASLSLGTLSTPYYIDRACPNRYFTKRFLAIRDESHKLESFYMQLLTSTITASNYQVCYPNQELPVYTDPLFWRDEIPGMVDKVDGLIMVQTLGLDKMRLKKLESLQAKLETLTKLLGSPDNVVIDIEKTQSRQNYYAKFRPVKVDAIASEKIDSVSDHTIFMSATQLSIRDRLDQLGLSPDDTLFINKTTSAFPDKNRHIIYSPQGSMSYKRREKTLPKIIEASQRLLDLHSEQRGVIIVGSHKIRDTIYRTLSSSHGSRLVTHESGTFDEQFNYFLDHPTEPLVFITTRYEGLDFYDKLAEFLVYVNLPYPAHQDKQVAARLKLEQRLYTEAHGNCGYTHNDETDMCDKSIYCHGCRRWYNLKVAEAIQQAVGRIIRTPDDIGFIYILDSRFKKFVKENDDLFIKYIKDSIEYD